MKILVMGDPDRFNPLMHFHCHSCGCEFVASTNECAREQGQYNETACRYTCPCCGRETYTSREYDRNGRKERTR